MVIGLKMKNSEIYVGDVVNVFDNGWELKTPFNLLFATTDRGVGVQWLPLFYMRNETLTFCKEDVLFDFELENKLCEDYKSQASIINGKKVGLILPNGV